MKLQVTSFLLAVAGASAVKKKFETSLNLGLGPRPFWLVEQMKDSPLKTQLEQCAAAIDLYQPSDFSIGHRGACMQFPEHTISSYDAAASMGAGILECDVTFTKDLELVCRHAQCDLHITTDVTTRPELNAKCTKPWTPEADGSPVCCTSDFTLAEIKTLCAKMDSRNDVDATTPEGYAFGGTADWRTDVYQAGCPSVPTHKESIEAILAVGAKFTPELKGPAVEMPFNGFSQGDYAQKMIDEYIEYGVPPKDVWPQSFNNDDVVYWVENTQYGGQAVRLDGEYTRDPALDKEWLEARQAEGIQWVAPPLFKLVVPNPNAGMEGELDLTASSFALEAKELGMKVLAWTLERTFPIEDSDSPPFYWQTTAGAGLGLTEGSRLELLHVLNTEGDIQGVFSDWPATTTFYANCFKVKLANRPLARRPRRREREGYDVAQLGPRPQYLVDEMKESFLKAELETCLEERLGFIQSDFAIGHRGACMQFPEHTIESYDAAAKMGAGILECDVTFTKDKELICRHAQCDLHTTTDVTTRPELNAKCTTPWSPGVSPVCCASDFTLEEIKTLCAKMDSRNDVNADTAEGYAFGGTADWRTDLYQPGCPRVPTHAESIQAIMAVGAKYTPELKSPAVTMPFDGFSQEDYAQKMIDEYIAAGVPPEEVWPQSFNNADVVYWVENTAYGGQAVRLDGEYSREADLDLPWLQARKAEGIQWVAPPLFRLVEANPNAGMPGELDMTANSYALHAIDEGLKVLTWTLDRTYPIEDSSSPPFYWQTLGGEELGLTEGSRMELLYVLYNEAQIQGIFDDWPSVSSFFANCYDIKLRSEV